MRSGGNMLPKKGKVLPKWSRGNGASVDFNQNIAATLRAELGSTHRAVKIVMGWTGASERAVKNWLAGTHGPSGGHFVALVRHSDEVLKALMTMAGRDSVLVAVSVVDVRRKLAETVEFIDEHMTR
jgi:hypothetical protein